jgi:hypothetical protein
MSKTLAIFDMDGTLLLSPGPEGLEGAAKKAFWKDPEPLENREAPVIESTREAYLEAQREGATLIVMTGRRYSPRMKAAAAAALEAAGLTGHAELYLKPQSEGDTGRWKEGMIAALARAHGASRVDLWDDRPEHAEAFRRVLEQHRLEGTVTDVADPRWSWGSAQPKDA